MLRYKPTTDTDDTPAAWIADIHSSTHHNRAGAHTCGRIQGTLSTICNNLITHNILALHVLTHAGCLDPALANDHCYARHCGAYVSAATGQKQTACTCTAAICFHCKPSWQIAVDHSFPHWHTRGTVLYKQHHIKFLQPRMRQEAWSQQSCSATSICADCVWLCVTVL